MRHLNLLSLLVVATLTISACSMEDKDMGYLGSRDDIIVTNKADAAKEEAKAKIETVKADAAAMAEDATNTAAEAEPMMATDTTDTTTATESAPAPMAGCNTSEIPPNAKPGECYAKVLIPAQVSTTQERVQVSEEQKVLARIIPAKYEIQKERVLVKEARTYWKAGQGAITKTDDVTGQIMCLVEEPAEYKTIEKRVLVTPEQPEYQMTPAQFETITKTQTIRPECFEWRRILCETNMGPNAIMRIQQALNTKGYELVVDGKLGRSTMDALSAYQRKNNLATQGITYETLEHLGVQLIGA